MTHVNNFVRKAIILVLVVMMVATLPMVAFAAEEEYEMPLYNQYDYAHVPYRSSNVARSGCGITSLAMVASYLFQDESITPEYLATVYGNHKEPVDGIDYSTLCTIMVTVGENLGLKMTLSYHWKDAYAALQEGKVVITLQNPGCFTQTPNGHFVVFRGLTEDGKKVLVNDPNGHTYKAYPDEFANGFPIHKVCDTGSGYWVVEIDDFS